MLSPLIMLSPLVPEICLLFAVLAKGLLKALATIALVGRSAVLGMTHLVMKSLLEMMHQRFHRTNLIVGLPVAKHLLPHSLLARVLLRSIHYHRPRRQIPFVDLYR